MNRKWIFEGDSNKTKCLEMLKRQAEDGLIHLIAWCIMDNHVHLVVKAELNKLKLAMRKMNTKYAIYFNSKNKLEGHVFQKRFKSQPIEEDTYLLQVVCYVHNNPAKAGIVNEVHEYKME